MIRPPFEESAPPREDHDDTGQASRESASTRDATDRKVAEQHLRESLERFELVARATNDALWDWNIDTGETWWGEGFQTLFGHFAEKSGSGFDRWASRVHPDDIDRVRAGIRAVIDSGGQTWSEPSRNAGGRHASGADISSSTG